jgi:hypothetical protein
MEKITVTEALAKVKLLDKKISKKIYDSVFVGREAKGKILDGFNPENAKADLQSIEDLIENRFKLKNAIHESNQKTKVIVDGKEYTVSEVIEYKTVIEQRLNLLRKMKNQLEEIRDIVNYENEKVQSRLDEQVSKLFEKPSKDEVEQFAKSFLKSNEHRIVDPIGLDEYIRKLEEEVDNFQSEVDFKLSTSNALTFIEI